MRKRWNITLMYRLRLRAAYLVVILCLPLFLFLTSEHVAATSMSQLASQRLLVAANDANQLTQKKAVNISSAQAAGIVRAATGGKILAVKPGHSAYRVKVLKKNGVVSNMNVDKRSGQLRGR